MLKRYGSPRLLHAATAAVALIALGRSSFADPRVYLNISNLLPNTPNQTVQIYVAGIESIEGENLNFQINAGDTGPMITGVDILSGTIFAGNNTGQGYPASDPNFNSQGIYTTGTLSGHLAVVLTTTATGTVVANGLLATLLVSTTASSGTFAINMISTVNGASNFGLGGSLTMGMTFPHNQLSIGSTVRQWNVNGGGGWDSDSNWTPFAPFAVGDTANFLGAATSGTASVLLGGQRIAGSVNFNNTLASYDVQAGSGGLLRLDNGTASAVISNLGGSHRIGAPIQLTSDTNVTLGGGSTLTLSGGISGALALAVSGSGRLVLTGANTYGATSIAAGSIVQVGNGTTNGSLGSAAISNNGSLELGAMNLPIAVPISGSGTVTIVGTVVLTNTSTAASMIITPSGVLQVGAAGSSGSLPSGSVVNSGTLSFSRVDSAAHGAVITGAGTLANAGTGTTTLSNYQGTGVINVAAGTLAFGTGSGIVKTPSLTIVAGTTLDLKNNSLLVQGSPGLGTWNGSIYSGALAQVQSGAGTAPFSGGLPTWTGTGITSTTAAATTSNGLAITDGATYQMLLGNDGDHSTFGGTAVNNTDVIVKYTWNGDANLDGVIDFWDYIQIDSGVQDQFNVGFPMNYASGDFNLDGTIDFWDYIMIDAAFQDQTGPLSGGSLIPAGGAGDGSAAVPEPASLMLLGLGLSGFLLRRRARV